MPYRGWACSAQLKKSRSAQATSYHSFIPFIVPLLFQDIVSRCLTRSQAAQHYFLHHLQVTLIMRYVIIYVAGSTGNRHYVVCYYICSGSDTS